MTTATRHDPETCTALVCFEQECMEHRDADLHPATGLRATFDRFGRRGGRIVGGEGDTVRISFEGSFGRPVEGYLPDLFVWPQG